MVARRLAAVDAVPVDGSLVFVLEQENLTREVHLMQLAGAAVTAWENHCPHRTDVRLDWSDGAAVRGDEPLCRKHGAMFDTETGLCTRGT